MLKKIWLLLLVVAVSAGLLCGSAYCDDLKRFKGQKLTVTCWSGPYTQDFKKAFAEPFMKASGATVIVTPGWSEFISKIKASPEDKPPYDVFMADGWNYIAAMNIDRFAAHPQAKHTQCQGHLSPVAATRSLGQRLRGTFRRRALPAGVCHR